jgi:hypothetical protein
MKDEMSLQNLVAQAEQEITFFLPALQTFTTTCIQLSLD